MSLWSRLVNLFRVDRVNREIDEELRSHLAEAIEQGRDPNEARRAFGSVLHQREQSRDIRLIAWLDALRADAVFGWRQLMKHKVTSAAAILSLALAIGACTSAFRMIDAMLLRPLPIARADRLYALAFQSTAPDGTRVTSDVCAYPMFRQMRALVHDQAELIAISNATRIDLTYGSDQDTEHAYQQYVSGWMFSTFDVQPALGRLLTEDDDLTPGAHPYAVLSHDYWTRRFGRDPHVIGRTFRAGGEVFEIVGVAQAPFVGTEPGIFTDIFVPTMMAKYRATVRSDYFWFKTFVALKDGVDISPVRERLRVAFHAFLDESVKARAGIPARERDAYVSQTLLVNPASAGVSMMQKEYGTSLTILGALVALVLLISCANVANVLTTQAAARGREMALRVSIGAGRGRLVQLVLVECAWLALLATLVGALFAWWSAPVVVGMISTLDYPARLALPADWRVLGFGLALALSVTILFGLAPALRASGVKPASALKGGDDPHARSRLMHALIAIQVAFCFIVLFIAGLFVATANRLSHQPTGFSDERLLTLETATTTPQSASAWDQVARHLRTIGGVEAVALCEWPLMLGGSWSEFIAINGAGPSTIQPYFLRVSPDWLDVMKIALIDGRDFRAADTFPGTAIVNEAFVRQYFGDGRPVGRSFEIVANGGQRTRVQIVGVTRDARYKNMREPIQPVAYVPFTGDFEGATFIVRTSTPNPLAMATTLRQEVTRAHAGFRVSTIRTQAELVQQHTVRERLLAMLALFFAAVALLLAMVGLYGVLDYSLLQRRRELGIRIAIGARPSHVARHVTVDILAMVVIGALAGAALGLASVHYIATLLYEVKATDVGALALPSAIILAVALLASLPTMIRAVRIDPVTMLRSE